MAEIIAFQFFDFFGGWLPATGHAYYDGMVSGARQVQMRSHDSYEETGE